ncbi:MAG: hypothetical protein K6U14_03685 [Firmicutes bacterium]|nr:hypothetical protein [Alicyclobacillaceae bacterium]MCL6496722.1 hypothetical protein [Bacillota bacterium]
MWRWAGTQVVWAADAAGRMACWPSEAALRAHATPRGWTVCYYTPWAAQQAAGPPDPEPVPLRAVGYPVLAPRGTRFDGG